MRFKVTGNKKDILAVVVKSDESALTILQGAPIFLKGDGTDDGLAVISAVNLAAASQGMFFGLATEAIEPGANGEAQVDGYYDYAQLRIATRAASTDPWASYAAGAIGDALDSIATGTGVVAASVSADQALINRGSVALSAHALIRLGATYASATTQASSLTAISGGTARGGATATAAFTTVKALLRAW